MNVAACLTRKGSAEMRYDYSQETANELLEAADLQIQKIINERDELVEALKNIANFDGRMSPHRHVAVAALAKLGADKTEEQHD